MKDLVVAVMVFASCAYNYALETGFACDETVLYDVLRTDAYEDELMNTYSAIGADKFYGEHIRYSSLPANSRRERELYGNFLHELMPVFERHAKTMYVDEEPDELDDYIASLIESGCLLKEEVAYLTDSRNRDEMRELYNHVCDLMKEPVDPDNSDSCVVGDFLEFDEVFGTELSIRTSKYMEQRYAEHDLKLVESNSMDYTDTDKAQAEYINGTLNKYIVAGAFNNTAQSGYKSDK